MIFPTRVKVRISSALSYPVGAELISSSLGGVPQAESFEICFYSKYERMKMRGEPCEVFSVSYAGTRSYSPGWSIVVYPVPRAWKHRVKESLADEFFPQIRKWLEKYAGLNSRHGAHGMRVIFDEFGETLLTMVEFHSPGDAFTN